MTALIPAVENMPGSRAPRPSDIVTSLSGKTIEVINTDAEGWLILADALTYAKQLGCTHLVDAAAPDLPEGREAGDRVVRARRRDGDAAGVT